MATVSPMILSMMIGIAFHNIVGTAARAEQGVTFNLRRLLRVAIFLLGLRLTSNQVIEFGGGGEEDVASAIAAVTVFGSAAMVAYPIPADGKAWIAAVTTFLPSIALAEMGLETNIGKPAAKSFRPAPPGAFAFFIAGFSLTLIKWMG
jgi:uncharacterized membrane protein YadS